MTDKKRVEAFDALVEHVAASASAATWPLYASDGEMVFRHVGTAIPLQLGKEYFVITAAHVADLAEIERLYLAQTGEMLDLGRAAVSTLLQGAKRKDDPLDVAVFYLPESQGRRLPDDAVTRVEDLDLPPAPVRDSDYFLIMGYPHTKQDSRVRRGSLECYLYRFVTLASGTDDYHTFSLRPATSLILSFQKNRMYQRGVQVTAPDLYGVSGGGVWRLSTNARNLLDTQPKLCGIAVEWRREPRERVLATRIIVPLSAIWRDHPELRRFLPSL